MVGRGLFLGVFFIAYAIQAITGFAGNIIAMPAGMATLSCMPT
ncbi:MAG: sulfite exporter TauE/SafE family protein, partial [Slackia sp.]|nr:sulfite exporter TauE/SafE family protein [Slackia sp.]